MIGAIKLPPRPHPKFPSVFDLEFRKELGRGAFATVYEAYHRPTDTAYAVKKLRFSQLTAADARNIENELMIHSQITHPNIVEFIDYIPESKAIFLVLELVPKGNLFQHMRRNRLSDSECRKIFHQVVGVLVYLHTRGIILRDLKPENILIDDRMNIRICDFGWATFKDNLDYCRSIAGTYCYMSPEGLRGESQTEKSDLWSLGVLLYELLFNKEPFVGKSVNEMLGKIYHEGYTVKAGADKEAVELMNSLLRADPRERCSLQMVLKSAYMRRMAQSVASVQNCLEIPGPVKTVLTDGSRPEFKTKTSLRPMELIRGKGAQPNSSKQLIRSDASPREGKEMPTPKATPALVPPLTSMGKKPFQNFPDLINLSKISHTTTSVLTSLALSRARSPEVSKTPLEPRQAPLTPQPSNIYASPSLHKAGEAEPRSIYQGLNQAKPPEGVSASRDHPLGVSGQGVSSSRFNYQSPEPSFARSRQNIVVDYSKRLGSPSLVASVGNSNIEIVLGATQAEGSPGQPALTTESSIMRDLAVNRRMIFSSPGSKGNFGQASQSGSPGDTQLAESDGPMPLGKLSQNSQFRPPPPDGTRTNHGNQPQAKPPSILDIIYKRSDKLNPQPRTALPPIANENINDGRSNTLHPASHLTRHPPPTSTGRVPAPQPPPRAADPTSTPGKPGSAFGSFLESMKSIARNW